MGNRAYAIVGFDPEGKSLWHTVERLMGLTVGVMGLCTLIALFAVFAEKTRAFEKVSRSAAKVISEKDLPR